MLSGLWCYQSKSTNMNTACLFQMAAVCAGSKYDDKIPINGSPCSITEHRVPELIPVLGSHSAGDVHKPGGRLPSLSARPAVTPTTLKRAATNFAAWWTEAWWVWTVCLRLLPDSVAAAIWTQVLLRLSPEIPIQTWNYSWNKRVRQSRRWFFYSELVKLTSISSLGLKPCNVRWPHQCYFLTSYFEYVPRLME